MINGSNSDILKSQHVTEVTNTENNTDSYDCQVFCIKDIYPESSNSSSLPISPSIKALHSNNSINKFDEKLTNSTNQQSRKMTEEVKSSVGTSITEFRLASLNSPEANKCMDIVMGCSPCSAYCGRCKNYVHTVIDYQEDVIPGYLLKISQTLMMCCGNLDWLNKYIIHRCPCCNLILGKI
ncbi:hypothetical protein SteCoe_37503 [Stentor coeruleus]|uniref:LITAF domain-containing protein n=1 Tax=Stentor coeruleus TaxID=5963 RepID=A0A1R2AMW1_9CILI|nr:hypothetical protein SteCoe_37503 [Stentor coeruleus]